ncbi:MAG TPA: cytochrome P450 [Solirubrobacteraceae bacterium]|nr:cytochrome P450 [Solirubrobacteraceae bacterium]
MTALASSPPTGREPDYSGEYAPSPAGPADGEPLTAPPPSLALSTRRQGLRFLGRPMSYAIGGHRRFGDVWTMRIPVHTGAFVVSCHPDHLASLLKANPDDAPSVTGDSPLREFVGPNSVLTSNGARHMRQRKLLLPAFHGEAVQRYVQTIADTAEAEIDRWPVGRPFALAPRMQAVTLAVIMRGVFGIEASAGSGTPEDRLRAAVRRMLAFSTTWLYSLLEIPNAGHARPPLPVRVLLADVHRWMDEVIAARRAGRAGSDHDRDDVLSLLLGARDDEGRLLTDDELRDELMALLLAGHETTANSLAWAFERLLRTPAAYDRLRQEVRSGDRARSDAYVEATIHETMRDRPVIPMIVRMVKRPWRLGEYVVAADTPVAISILGLHHRDDLYPEPQVFEPERFLGRKPGTYTWIPFGGGIRRCLGASLAMAEQRLVLEAIARRTDLAAGDSRPESPRMRNVTMIPGRGCRVTVNGRR